MVLRPVRNAKEKERSEVDFFEAAAIDVEEQEALSPKDANDVEAPVEQIGKNL